MELSLWLAFVATVGAVFLTPGPTILMVVTFSLRYGRGAVPYLMAGVTLADLCFVTLGLYGIAALIEASPWLYWTLRLAGLAYVGHLVWKLWQAPPLNSQGEDMGKELAVPGRWSFTRHAFFTTITNPKGFLFVFGLFPTFVPEGGDFATREIFILTATFLTLSMLVSGSWGFFGAHALGAVARWQHLGKVSACLIVIAVAWVWLSDFWNG